MLRCESSALAACAEELDADFVSAVRWIASSGGHLAVCGMGKAGWIGRKVSSTLASLGMPSFYLHPAEALHGDLGRLAAGDRAIALSYSGRTGAVLRLVDLLRMRGHEVLAVTGDRASPLAEQADLTLAVGQRAEACHLGLAPTTSSTLLLAMGDALAVCAAQLRGVTADQFAERHPGGSLGRDLLPVREVMRQGERNPLVAAGATLAEAIAVMTATPGRPGAAVVVDAEQRLQGIFTDGDLRRLVLAPGSELDLDRPVVELMASTPRTVEEGVLVAEAACVLREHGVDQVVVVDDQQRAVGLLDVQDLLAVNLL